MSNNTRELITILKKNWEHNNSNKKHLFYEYIKERHDEEKRWIWKQSLEYVNDSINGLNAYTKLIYVDKYNMFAGFSKTSSPLKNW